MTSFASFPQARGPRYSEELFVAPSGQYLYDRPLIPPLPPPRFGLPESQIRPRLDVKSAPQPVAQEPELVTLYPSYTLKTPDLEKRGFWGK